MKAHNAAIPVAMATQLAKLATRFLATILATLFLTPILAPPVNAQKASVVRSAWAFGCGKAASGRQLCQIQRSVKGPRGKAVLMQIVITRVAGQGKGKGFARFIVPLAVDLPSGVTYAVTTRGAKGQAQKAGYKSCSPKGCIAPFALNDKLMAALKSGRKLDISFKMRDLKAVRIGVDLKGFTAAYSRLFGK